LPFSETQLIGLARRHQTRLIGLQNRTVTTALRAWDKFGGLTDAERARFVGVVAPVVEQAMRSAEQMVDAYLFAVVRSAGEIAPDVSRETFVYRQGVDLTDSYARPIIVARVAVANGATYAQAITAGRARVTQLADTDPMLAARHRAREIMASVPRIVGYRRVPDGGACQRCLLAATQRYHVGDLMPVHAHCHCTVAPIMGTVDPGRIIERDALKALKASTGPSVNAVRTVLSPEMGPTLEAA
jgi:hypothetical protein